MRSQPSLDTTVGVQASAMNQLALSDDECVRKLAMLVEHRDDTNLDEIVALISRLTLPIEWP